MEGAGPEPSASPDPLDPALRQLIDAVGVARAAEQRARRRTRVVIGIASVAAMLAAALAMAVAAHDENFGAAPDAMRVMFWVMYLLFVAVIGIAVRAGLTILLRGRTLEARAVTARASAAVNAWHAADHYRPRVAEPPAGAPDTSAWPPPIEPPAPNR